MPKTEALFLYDTTTKKLTLRSIYSKEDLIHLEDVDSETAIALGQAVQKAEKAAYQFACEQVSRMLRGVISDLVG